MGLNPNMVSEWEGVVNFPRRWKASISRDDFRTLSIRAAYLLLKLLHLIQPRNDMTEEPFCYKLAVYSPSKHKMGRKKTKSATTKRPST